MPKDPRHSFDVCRRRQLAQLVQTDTGLLCSDWRLVFSCSIRSRSPVVADERLWDCVSRVLPKVGMDDWPALKPTTPTGVLPVAEFAVSFSETNQIEKLFRV